MDSQWDDGTDRHAGGDTGTTGDIRGVHAPSGAVIVDEDALHQTFYDTIERFFGEADDDWQSDDLAWALVRAIQRTAS